MYSASAFCNCTNRKYFRFSLKPQAGAKYRFYFSDADAEMSQVFFSRRQAISNRPVITRLPSLGTCAFLTSPYFTRVFASKTCRRMMTYGWFLFFLVIMDFDVFYFYLREMLFSRVKCNVLLIASVISSFCSNFHYWLHSSLL